MAVLIEARELRKRFGAINAVDGISLAVTKGEVLGFLGPNGAGKSTTMKMLTGFLEPDSGSAWIGGISVADQPIIAKAKLGYMPEGAPAYGDMNTRRFLQFIAEVRGFDGAEANRRVEAAVEKAALQSVLDQKIDTLSKGFKRRVGMAQAILHDPQVLIMDEPTDGLDPNQKHHVRKLIAEMAKDKAIIVSTHILEEVEAVCSRAVIINKGRIVADGTAESLMRRLSYHGTVAMHVPSSRVEAVKKALLDFSAIASVETIGSANGKVRLQAAARDGAPAAPQLATLIRTRLIEAEEVVVQRGSLDEVFRQITTSDDGARHG
ncbi:MAG TPA: ATP-binding cassette domain-containing protein [Hyphomicrobiaceae bacterium]|nr:ATP-binding cassette domain-containing protein [Hyphomicrobiaceae bacterium]